MGNSGPLEGIRGNGEWGVGSGEEGFSLFVVRETNGSLAPLSTKLLLVGWELPTLLLSIEFQCSNCVSSQVQELTTNSTLNGFGLALLKP